MRIALIGPGKIVTIPPKGWGAIESLIWDYKVHLERLGHQVVIFQSPDLESVAEQINSNPFDFVHLHYDDHVGFFNQALRKPYCVSAHYGYLNDESVWGLDYFKFFSAFLRAPGIIALSDASAEKYRSYGYRGFLRKFPNGAEVSKFKLVRQGNGRAIVLGKIDRQDRKRQVLLSRLLNGSIDVDFVGPNENAKFRPEGTCRYLGEWDKDTVYGSLSNYSCLVLLSEGEVAPLVVPEAMAAGLSIVVSETASANLDPRPFISVVTDDCRDKTVLVEAIRKQIAENARYRNEIRKYAEESFDWSILVPEYLKLIEQFNREKRGLQKGSLAADLRSFTRYLRLFSPRYRHHFQIRVFSLNSMTIFARKIFTGRPILK